MQAAAQNLLGKIHTFNYITVLAPHLLTLIENKAKGVELDSLIKEMQAEVAHIHAKNGSRLCKVVSFYAAPNPHKQLVQPPISAETKAGCARMGINHPQLARIVQKCFEDPSNPMKVTANVWPAYLYPGDTPGSEYDPKEIGKGLFQGYLVECTIKHIFTSPSSALHERAKGARSGNAKIHKMRVIEPEHIAYTAMQARFMILSAEKWSDQDGLFNYTEYYYRIIHLIHETKDRAWVNGLIECYNKKIFGNPKGLISTNTAITMENGDDDLLEMEHQFEECEAGEIELPSRPDLRPSIAANTESTASNGSSESLPVAMIARKVSAGPPSNVSASELSSSTPGPGPSTLKKRKQLAQDLFDDDIPLMDEECEPKEPPVKKKHGCAPLASKKAPGKSKAGRAKA
ncbi:hypothetical protein OG21DRAFT_1527674 [Imleria badia]|nr:hypothetical protein OG21DRAFT_1527674 [Imleria badia]